MSIIAVPSSAPFRSAIATTSARVATQHVRSERRCDSTKAVAKPESAQHRERTCVILNGVPRTFTNEDVLLRLRKTGALRKGDISLTSIVGRPRPHPPSMTAAAMPTSHSTSFHLTFPNFAAAEHAQRVLHSNNGRARFLDLREDRRNDARKSMKYIVEGNTMLGLTSQLVKQDAKDFWENALKQHVHNNHFFKGGKKAKRTQAEVVDDAKETEAPAEGEAQAGPKIDRGAARQEELQGIINAFKRARIGPFGVDEKMRIRGEPHRSGRQVVLYGLPENTQSYSLKPILKGFKLDESDPLFDVPIRSHTFMKTFIVTLADVAEAHRFVRKINMQDVAGEEGPACVVRADIMW